MPTVEITSRNNEKVKHFIKLAESARQRRAERLFALEGVRLCCDAACSGFAVAELYFTDTAAQKYAEQLSPLQACAQNSFLISEDVSAKLSDTVHPQGVFCLVQMKPDVSAVLVSGKKYIALENVQTPDNLGAVARTAEALGIDALVTAGGCDIYNPKALRAAMGSLLRLPVVESPDLELTVLQAKGLGLPVYVTVPAAQARQITEIDFSGGAVVVIGNEGKGISPAIQAAATERITIPMRGKAESLNASAAAVITMWEMMK